MTWLLAHERVKLNNPFQGRHCHGLRLRFLPKKQCKKTAAVTERDEYTDLGLSANYLPQRDANTSSPTLIHCGGRIHYVPNTETV